MKQIRLIHFALIAGVSVFLAVSIYLNMSETLHLQYDAEFSNILFLITAAMTAIMLPLGYIIFRRQIVAVEKSQDLGKLMTIYKSAYIVKMGLIEAPAFFSIVVFLLTGNLWLLIQIIAVLLVMIINRPTADKIVNELGLERSQIQDIKELNSF